MKHKGTITLETDRLILRQFTKKDIMPSFQNWTNDETMTKYLTWQPHGTIEVTENILSEWIEKYKTPDFYQWAIVPKSENEVIGVISVVSLNEEVGIANIGYCIGSKWWNMGYTSEAFATIIPFLFEQVKVQRIAAAYDPNNPNSGRVMKKCGLQYEGTLRKASKNNQGINDLCIYSILSSDYFQNDKK